MATSVSIQVNTITESSISITMIVNVTYAGSYYLKYGIEGIDVLYSEEYQSSTFSLSAGGSTNSPYKNFTGLKAGSTYRIWCELYNASTGVALGITDETEETTETAILTYYAKLILDGNGGTLSNGGTTSTWTANTDSEKTYAYIPVTYNCSFIRSGYTFLGFSDSPDATSASYEKSDTYIIYSDSTSSSSPAVAYLYAVWQKPRPNDWAWPSTVQQGAAVPTEQISDRVYQAAYLTAVEWAGFISRVQEFAEYLGVNLRVSDINGASATRGEPMYKTQAQSAVNLLTALDPPIAPLAVPNSMTAAFINGLKNSLNSIP